MRDDRNKMTDGFDAFYLALMMPAGVLGVLLMIEVFQVMSQAQT